MASKKRRAITTPQPPRDVAPRGTSALTRLAGGRPRVVEIVALLAIGLVIGASAVYLAVRFTQPAGAPTAGPAPTGDPAAMWRARLLESPNDVEALLGLGHVQLDQQQLEEAERLYRHVLSMDAKNVEAITHLGNVFLSRGQPDEALRRYDEALRIQPAYVHALWDKANTLQDVKRDYPAAIQTWEAFIQQVGRDSQDGQTAAKRIVEARAAMSKSP
jgi:tetratricopeptide (TPR) repeat protein